MQNNEELLKELAAMKGRITAIEKQVEADDFPTERWYKNAASMVYRKGDKDNYGVHYIQGWDTNLLCTLKSQWTPMTNSETIEMLKDQCEKRGIVLGAKLGYDNFPANLPISKNGWTNIIRKWDRFEYNESEDYFSINSIIVYRSGIFATPIPEAITVGGVAVEYDNDGVLIANYWYNKSIIQHLIDHPDLQNPKILKQIAEGFGK